MLYREVRWQSPIGHTIDLRFERFTSLADEHTLALCCQITSIDYAGPVEVHAGLNGYSDNEGVMHWEWLDQGGSDHSIWLHVRSRHSKIELGIAARLAIVGAESESTLPIGFQGCPTLVTTFEIQPGQTVTLEKVVTVFTSATHQLQPSWRRKPLHNCPVSLHCSLPMKPIGKRFGR